MISGSLNPNQAIFLQFLIPTLRKPRRVGQPQLGGAKASPREKCFLLTSAFIEPVRVPDFVTWILRGADLIPARRTLLRTCALTRGRFTKLKCILLKFTSAVCATFVEQVSGKMRLRTTMRLPRF